MNVYDFDQTIFHPDSSVCFICYCLRHRTLAVSKSLPSVLLRSSEYVLRGRKDATRLKESLFSFLNRIDNIDYLVHEFWGIYETQLAPWYLKQMSSDDVIISASPEFLLQPIADRLGVHLIATKMNPYNGRISGRNCHDREKVRRFLEYYPVEAVDEFYSDSLSDEPMARIAGRAYLVHGDAIKPWEF